MDRFDALIKTLRARCPGLELRENEPMSAHTTFRVGGPARLFLLPGTDREAEEALGVCLAAGVRPFFMGNGSNLLVADGGYDGAVLCTGKLGRMSADSGRVTAGSGVSLPKLAAFAASRSLTGLEFASGIPGTVGGGVLMNAGAYGGETAQVVECVTYLDGAGERHTLPAAECGFGYRRSVFAGRPDLLILSAALTLVKGDRGEITARMAELNARRREKQPLEYPSAGSTFKRPAPADGRPRYAAALIDSCGLKGMTVGGAQVSEKHAGFVINRGDATAADILALAEQVRGRVLDRTGVELELEIRTLGM